MDLNGEVYELVIETKVLSKSQDIAKEAKASVTDKSVINENKDKESSDNTENKTTIKNIATSSLNDNPQDTNEVENYLKPTTAAKTPAKNVDSHPAQSTAKMAQTGSYSLLNDLIELISNFIV